MFGYNDSGSFFTLYLFFVLVSMHYNENADLSDSEDDELLPLEVGTEDDQENQADAVASAATATTATSVKGRIDLSLVVIANLVEGKTCLSFEKK